MPEEIEVDTDRLRETIDEEIERKEGPLLRWISLTTALLAALAAIASLRAGSTVNEALVLKTEATRLQAQASDQWAYYQAKGIKAAVTQDAINAWTVAGKAAPAALATQAARYAAQQDTIRDSAAVLEHRRDEQSHEADELLEHHERYAAAVALFQISIALGAIAALTRNKPVWLGSLVAGAAGVALMVLASWAPGGG
ncbi:MAG TPA: DUF4337 domain-containing protein [Gemmatimonadaceae bacterium]|nr:DUF4337 domain-containing protein [Gemmatimonadaceae bacterium]